MSFFSIEPIGIDSSNLTASNVAITTTQWSNASTYALKEEVYVLVGDTYNLYESLQAGNINHDPEDDIQGDEDNPPVWWVLKGVINRYKMFDQKNSSKTTNADSIAVTVQASGVCDSVSLFGVSAASVQIVHKKSTGEVIETRDISMVLDTGPASYFSWFFGKRRRKNAMLETGFAPFNNAIFEITITDTGETVECGTCIIGKSQEFGGTQYGAADGIRDYSQKVQDRWGEFSVQEGDYSDEASFQIMVDNESIDQLKIYLQSRRAKATLYVGDSRFSSLWVYGFYERMQKVIPYHSHSLINLDLIGLPS